MKWKGEAAAKLREYKTFYENQWGERIKYLRSDNRTEFVNQVMTKINTLNGIVHLRTVPYSPQQNRVAERMNHTIMEKSRSGLHYKGVPTDWWDEAVSTAIYLINRYTITQNATVTLFELDFKLDPQIDHRRVIDFRGYAQIYKSKKKKTEHKRFRCLLLGYPENVKRHRVYNLDASKVKVSCFVKSYEHGLDGIYDTKWLRTERSCTLPWTPMQQTRSLQWNANTS